MEARVKILGHPIHQSLIVLPLGLLMGAVIFDILYLITRGSEWPVVAYWLIAVGVLTGLLAAVFGLLDWTKIPKGTRAKRIGVFHGLGNVVVVTLFAVSWFMRGEAMASPSGWAIALSLIGGGLALVTGWLGGELVGRLGVGVDEGAHLNAPNSLAGKPATATAGTRG